jgi:hypothetical protein
MVPVRNRADRRITRRDLDASRAEMDLAHHRFLYYGDADAHGDGKVISPRRDGDYGVVEAA